MTDSSTPAIARTVATTRTRTTALAAALGMPRAILGPWLPRALAPRQLLKHVLLAAAYVVAGKLGLLFGIIHPSASAVWAPSGISLAAIMLLGYDAWPGIFFGAFVVNVTTAGSPATSFGIAVGNTLEALVGAALANRYASGRHAFERLPDTFRFAALAGLLAPALSASLGVTSLALGGFARWAEFGSVWLTWWLGDLSGVLVIAPLAIVWLGLPRPRWTRAQAVEAASLLVAVLILGQWVFGTSTLAEASGHPLKFLFMPLLAWAAFRFDQRITTAATFEIAAIAIWGTLTSAPPADRRALNEALVLHQIFMGVAAVTTLALAAVVAERRRVDEAVQATADELHEAMTELEALSRSITHDLRSPIGAVLNYSAVLTHDFGSRLDEDGIRVLRRIRTSAESAGRLLDQLTQYTWVGRERGEQSNLDMTALAREVYAEFVVAGEDVSDLEFELHPLPEGRGSPELFRCVFRNLLSNAVKYTRGRPGRRVVVAGEAGAGENTYTVTDNGIGFDPAQCDALFEPFLRLAPAREVEGTGLGLAIVARIIRRQRGRIWAESDGRHGARFAFTLPTGGSRACDD
jgi:signal transduction histidine kinase